MPPLTDIAAVVDEATDIVMFVRIALVDPDKVKAAAEAEPEGSAEKN